MLIALNRVLGSQRRRIALTFVAVALAVSVLSAHSALTGGHHMGMGIAMCAAVMDTALLAAGAALALRRPTVRLRLAAWSMTPQEGPPPQPPQPRARASPAVLQVFRT